MQMNVNGMGGKEGPKIPRRVDTIERREHYEEC